MNRVPPSVLRNPATVLTTASSPACPRWRARARAGAHRDPSRPAVSPEEADEGRRADEQDAALFIVAAFTGLRMGELLALRWRHVDLTAAKLLVEGSWSAGRLTTPKSRA